MATSRTGLANIALTKVGKNRLTDIDADTTEEAIVCRLLFDELRDEILFEGKWAFALKRAALAQLSSTPEFGFGYEFQLPTDYIKIVSINETTPGDIEFQIEGTAVLSDESTIGIRYVSQETNVAKWSPGFKKVFTLRLAAEIAHIFRADKALTQGLFQLYLDALSTALAHESQQGTRGTIPANQFIEVR